MCIRDRANRFLVSQEYKKYIKFNSDEYAEVFLDDQTPKKMKNATRILFFSGSLNYYLFFSELNRKIYNFINHKNLFSIIILNLVFFLIQYLLQG